MTLCIAQLHFCLEVYPYPEHCTCTMYFSFSSTFLCCAVSSLDRNVQKVNQMLHEMRVIAVDKESTDGK